MDIGLEAIKLSFGLAKDLSVQLVTLSAVIIGISVTLSKDRAHGTLAIGLLVASWVAYFTSIVGGIGALMFMTGSLVKTGHTGTEFFISDNTKNAAGFQIVGFGVGTLLFMTYGLSVLISLRRRNDT